MSPPEFSIICRTHGGPATNVEWFPPLSDEMDHESSQLIVDTSYNTVYENRLLVRGSHSGHYLCRIENNIRDYFPTASYLVQQWIQIIGMRTTVYMCLVVCGVYSCCFFFFLNSRIPLVRSSSKSAVSRLPTWTAAKVALAAPVHGPTLRGPASNGSRRRPRMGLASGALLRQPSSRLPASERSPTDPALRANPFPEVTDPFCRLPLPTLFYRLEAVHLGDLMRGVNLLILLLSLTVHM